MGLMDQAKKDIQYILTSSEGFSLPIIFTPPTGSPVTIKGVPIKHELKYDEFGNPVASKTSRITITEQSLLTAGYTVRNNSNEIYLIGHKVTWTDVMGNTWTYTIRLNLAGETNGIIVLILDDYKA